MPPRLEAAFHPRRSRGTAAAKTPHRVVVSNRGKLFWPADGLTKGDLCDYYEAIAPAILPYLRDRPVALVRHPDGITGKSFFQWNVPPALPSWVKTFELPSDEGKGKTRVFLLEDAASLLYVANMGCIPLHVLACRSSTRDLCDFFTIDFDVKASSLDRAVMLARTLRGLLEAIGLSGYPKTSGQSGLHVLVPLGEGQSFTTARALADLLGRLLVTKHPDIATMERRIEKRGPRVYVDTGQTGTSRTIVSPYSVRAWPGAPVSMPLQWDEVQPTLDPKAFTIRTSPSRYARLGDPMQRLLGEKPDVAKAVARLEKVLASGA